MEAIEIQKPLGATKNRKKLGRGIGSGTGKTSGKGNKGQNARSGGGVRPGFEGGQMPLYRRIARRGFCNDMFSQEFAEVNLLSLEEKFNDGDEVTIITLKEKGLVRNRDTAVKVLGSGDLTKKLVVKVERLSASAKEKIEKAGGSVVELAAKSE